MARFRTTIQSSGKKATGITVPPEVVASFGSGKRPPVRVTINGYTYQSTVAVMGGEFVLGVSAEVRERAGVAAGDNVDVDLELDTQPRRIEVPPDFAKALKKDPAANRTFDGLSYSNKQWHVLSIEGAKSAETRERRITKSISVLREGRAR